MSNILNIITNPDPRLRIKSKKIDIEKIMSSEFQSFCADMKKTMIKKDGIGLAAPQAGRNIRLIAVNSKDNDVCMINPEIIKKSLAKEWSEEGCLSVPNFFGEVKRHRTIHFTYYNARAEKKKIAAHGLLARVIQHEIDHLDGILFIDKVRKLREIK